jgi:DNA-binding response OmpR family regulator
MWAMHSVSGSSDLSLPRNGSSSSSAGSGKAVLLVSGEPFVRELLTMQLRAAGCFPMAVASIEDGQRLAAQLVPDLILLDLDTTPDRKACWVRQMGRSATGKPVRTVLLSTDVQRDCGPDNTGCGADLCVAKPFEPRELMRQLLGLMRPSGADERRPRARPALKAAFIELDRQQPTVRLLLHGEWHALDLPWTEHRLLECLLSDTARARSRDEIRDAVWSDPLVDLRTVDQNVRRLRRTLATVGASDLVKTVQGIGYGLDLGALKRLQA